MRYLPALDGLRALAVLAVLFLHTELPGFRGGGIGVDVFFVLSGYLITRILAEQRPPLGEFYLRRARRLVPALSLMLLAYLAVYSVLIPDWNHLRDAGIAFFYLADYTRPFLWLPKYIAHTWTLAVEEHFYLLWPLVFYRFRPTVRALLVAYIAVTLWRWANIGPSYHRFDTRMGGLILGCIIAGIPRDRFPAWPSLVVLFSALIVNPYDYKGFQGSFGYLMTELAAAGAILGTPPQWLSRPSLAYIGKISYGIYLWHMPIVMLFREYRVGWGMTTVCTLALSVGFAALSYHTLEARFREGRKHAPAPVTA